MFLWVLLKKQLNYFMLVIDIECDCTLRVTLNPTLVRGKQILFKTLLGRAVEYCLIFLVLVLQ